MATCAHCICVLISVSIASRADRTRTMKKYKRELGKLRLLVSITLASICVRDLKRDLECRVRCTKRIYIKAHNTCMVHIKITHQTKILLKHIIQMREGGTGIFIFSMFIHQTLDI